MFGSKTVYTDYKVIEIEELEDNHDYEMIETIYVDEIKRTPMGNSFKEYVLRKPKFLVGLRKEKHIKKLKDELRIGSKNFPEYERMRQLVDTKENEIKKAGDDLTPLKNELKDARERLMTLKRHLGSDHYNNLMNQHDVKKRQEAQSGTPQATARG